MSLRLMARPTLILPVLHFFYARVLAPLRGGAGAGAGAGAGGGGGSGSASPVEGPPLLPAGAPIPRAVG
jgi:hypothetical protein